MERETKTIKLSNCEVDIITYLTWGEKEDIQGVIMAGANVDQTGLSGFDHKAIRESKYRALEICVKGVRADGETKPFSREWMDNLSVEDGDYLYSEIDASANPKKK